MPVPKGKPATVRKAVKKAAKAVEGFIDAPLTEEERAVIRRFFSASKRSQLLWWGSWYADNWDWPDGGHDTAHAWVEGPNPFSRYALLFLQDGVSADGDRWGVKAGRVCLEFTEDGLEAPPPHVQAWFAQSPLELEPLLSSRNVAELVAGLERLRILKGRATTQAEVTAWLSHDSKAVREAAFAVLPSIRIE